MKPALAGTVAPRAASPNLRRGLIIVVVLIAAFIVNNLVIHHETAYERIAREMTVALQNNDLAGVERFQNAETATQVTHAIVGRDADAFAPLGKLQRVRETSEVAERRIHEFDATFDKGVVHETIRFDPDNKVVGFKYELPAPK